MWRTYHLLSYVLEDVTINNWRKEQLTGSVGTHNHQFEYFFRKLPPFWAAVASRNAGAVATFENTMQVKEIEGSLKPARYM